MTTGCPGGLTCVYQRTCGRNRGSTTLESILSLSDFVTVQGSTFTAGHHLSNSLRIPGSDFAASCARRPDMNPTARSKSSALSFTGQRGLRRERTLTGLPLRAPSTIARRGTSETSGRGWVPTQRDRPRRLKSPKRDGLGPPYAEPSPVGAARCGHEMRMKVLGRLSAVRDRAGRVAFGGGEGSISALPLGYKWSGRTHRFSKAEDALCDMLDDLQGDYLKDC